MTDYKDFDLTVLETMLASYAQQQVEATLAKKTDELKLVMAEIGKISKALAKKKPEVVPEQPTTHASTTLSVQKFVETQISNIEEFKPGVDVAIFLQACENAYSLVKSQPQGEKLLVQYLPMRLCQEFQTAWFKYCEATPVSTFDGFKEYMRTTHASQTTTFQLLDRFDLLQKDASENYGEYAIKVTNHVSRMAVEIMSKFSKATGREMLATDVFKMYGGVAMIREVRKSRECYHAIMTQVKDDLDASSIGQLAGAYEERREKEDPVLSNQAVVNYANSKPRGVCFNYRETGRCKFGKKCRYRHVRDSARGDDKNSGRNQSSSGGGKGGRDRKPDDKRASKVQFADGEAADDGDYERDAYTVDADQVFRN